ncbi:MAG: sigma-70 family RNA polymerase sigma factor [Oscillibacter sp.]|nr:sigma-70 family RNA polymerase sigma factor [Oscillibacter sp.]
MFDSPTESAYGQPPEAAPVPDEELCRRAASGDPRAEDALVRRHYRLVRSCARPFFLAGWDSEDLIQEGMLGLIKAIREYDPRKEASFRTFAEICVRSRLSSLLRDSVRDKRKASTQSVSLNSPGFDGNARTLLPPLAQRDPEEYLIDRERATALLSSVRKRLSEFEAVVLGYYLDGLSCGEIAGAVGKPPKSVDNAVQRIRRKVARRTPSGDLSES